MFTIKLDTTQLAQGLDALALRQLPFAVSLAMNRTAEEARDRQRQQLHLSFTIRGATSAKFLEQQVQVTELSHKNTLAVTVGLRGPGADLLSRHEKGGPRSAPASGPFFIPTQDLRGTTRTVIPKAMYPKALRLAERRDIVGSMPALRKGKRRTFIIIPKGNPRAKGIYERYGPRRDEIRLIWAFRPVIKLEPRLRFVETVTRLWQDRFAINFQGMLAHAMRTAK